jgi:hypothetical protein
MSSHSASDASGDGSVSGRLDSKYVTRTLEAERADSLLKKKETKEKKD